MNEAFYQNEIEALQKHVIEAQASTIRAQRTLIAANTKIAELLAQIAMSSNGRQGQ